MVLPKLATTKKAQSALEFLTTYGWAFLVILIMIGALSYFGVLDPSKFLPDKCLFGAGIGGCTDSAAITTGIIFKVVNNFGKDVTFSTTGSSVSVSGLQTPCSPTLTAIRVNQSSESTLLAAAAPLWNSSNEAVFFIPCAAIASGERPSAKIVLAYTAAGSSYAKTVVGEVSVRKP